MNHIPIAPGSNYTLCGLRNFQMTDNTKDCQKCKRKNHETTETIKTKSQQNLQENGR